MSLNFNIRRFRTLPQLLPLPKSLIISQVSVCPFQSEFFFYPILSNLFISNLTYNALHFETQIFSVCWFVHVQVKLDNADVIIHVSVVNCNDWLLLFCHKMYFACEENLWSKLSKMQNINYKISQFQVVGHCLHSLLFYNHYQIINREKVRKTKCCESSSILFRHQNSGVRPWT